MYTGHSVYVEDSRGQSATKKLNINESPINLFDVDQQTYPKVQFVT
jgi:hypothetical protein